MQNKTMQLKLATFNIHKGVMWHMRSSLRQAMRGEKARPQLRIHALREAIASLDADIVFLQEVQHVHRTREELYTLWPNQPQHEFLAKLGGATHDEPHNKSSEYYSAYETNAHTKHGEHGNALLSRYPLLSVAHRDMSDHRYEQRGLLHVCVALTDKVVLHTVCVHLGLLAASRARQVAILKKFVAEHVPPGAPLVIAGDFNDWHGRIKPEQLGEGVQDATHEVESSTPLHPLLQKFGKVIPEKFAHQLTPWGRRQQRIGTFPAPLPLLPLDRLYVRGFKVVSLEVPRAARGTVWHRVSDHAPLVVHVELQA
jgi:endonuclease/exonuclease/phosphatase family metal-dependent hydrolase